MRLEYSTLVPARPPHVRKETPWLRGPLWHPAAAALVLIAAALVFARGAPTAAAQDDSNATPVGAKAATRVAELRARIAELEAELKRAAADKTDSSAADASKTGAPIETVSTEEAGAAGLKAQPGTASTAEIAKFVELVEARDGPGLYIEVRRHITRGEEGFRVLYDYLHRLDEERRVAGRFVANYDNGFGLMHIAMLHDVELARFSHFYLNATRSEPRSFMREQLYSFIPVFLRFYRGRFPDLERAFEADIVRLLESRDVDLRVVFGAIRILELRPPLDLFMPILNGTNEYRWIALLTDHLADRDTEEATRALVDYIRRNGMGDSREARRAVTALARMTTVEAGRSLEVYLRRAFLKPVTVGFESYYASLVVEYLDSRDTLGSKRNLVSFMGRTNPSLLPIVFGHLDEVADEEARKVVVEQMSSL